MLSPSLGTKQQCALWVGTLLQSAAELAGGDEGPLCLPLDTEPLGTLDEMEKAASSDTQLFQNEAVTI